MTRLFPSFTLSLIVLLAACATPEDRSEQAREVLRYPVQLGISVQAEEPVYRVGEKVRIIVTARNRMAEPLTFFSHSLSTGQMLDVFRADGSPLPKLPPPPPLTENEVEAYRISLAAGESFSRTLELPVDPAFLTPGTYRVRANNAESNEAEFRVIR